METEHLWDRFHPALNPDDYVELRYEDLLEAPKAHLERLCSFLGVDYSPAMLSYSETTRFEKPDPKFAYQWKREHSPLDIRLVESKASDLLAQRGYELSTHTPLKPGFCRRAALHAHDRVSKIRFRIRQFGLPLVLGEFITRKMHVKNLHRRYRSVMDQIVTGNLR